MGRINVVGLGPAGPEYLTQETVDLLGGDAPVWLRTERHPAAVDVIAAGSFDPLYESLDSFDEVYRAVVDALIELANTHGAVVYAVPGSPMVAERTVELLRVHDDVVAGVVDLDIRPAMAFTDLCWNALGIDPMAEAVTIIDARSLATQGTGLVGPLLVTQVHSGEVLEDVISVLDDTAPDTVTILRGLGTKDEQVSKVQWDELRHTAEPDHLTSLWIPRLDEPLGAAFARLDELVRGLRMETRHDQEHSLWSLRESLPTTMGAAIDAIDALRNGVDDAAFDLEDSLADVLFSLVEAARVASEGGYFTIHDLAEAARERYS